MGGAINAFGVPLGDEDESDDDDDDDDSETARDNLVEADNGAPPRRRRTPATGPAPAPSRPPLDAAQAEVLVAMAAALEQMALAVRLLVGGASGGTGPAPAPAPLRPRARAAGARVVRCSAETWRAALVGRATASDEQIAEALRRQVAAGRLRSLPSGLPKSELVHVLDALGLALIVATRGADWVERREEERRARATRQPTLPGLGTKRARRVRV